MIKWYAVWMEGYCTQGNSSKAKMIGMSRADSFQEACEVAYTDKDGKVDELFDPERLTYWGCRLFDNEREARKSFG